MFILLNGANTIALYTYNNNTLFKYIYAHKHDTYLLYQGVIIIPIKGLLTEL